MSFLLNQINKTAIDQDRLASQVLENTLSLFEGFSNASISLMCESASNYLDQVIKQLQSKQLQNPENVVDMVTGLRVLGSAQSREQFHIKLPTFKVLSTKAGEADNVDATLVKLARNPSAKSIRDNIQSLITNAGNGDNAAIQNAVKNIEKLKLGYERVQTKLDSAGQEQQSSTKPSAKPAPNRATNQQTQSQPNNN